MHSTIDETKEKTLLLLIYSFASYFSCSSPELVSFFLQHWTLEFSQTQFFFAEHERHNGANGNAIKINATVLFPFSFVSFSETVGHTIRILKQFCLDQDKKN